MVISASGDAAEGEWAKGVLVEGVVRFGGGGEYEGELDEAMRPHGAGSLTDADGLRYDGEFKEGLRHGAGVAQLADGAEYDGEWVAGERSGRGRLRSADGETYDGELKGGRRHGRGVARYADGSSYEGEWADDEPHGVGNLYGAPAEGAAAGAAAEAGAGEMYGGHWEKGRRHGHGVHSYASGAIFDGAYERGERHGRGLLTLFGGAVLAATWERGAISGEGTVTYPDGSSAVLRLEAMTPPAAAPELCCRPRTAEGVTFHFPNGDVYTGEFEKAPPKVVAAKVRRRRPRSGLGDGLGRGSAAGWRRAADRWPPSRRQAARRGGLARVAAAEATAAL